jgi:hypothetical protein
MKKYYGAVILFVLIAFTAGTWLGSSRERDRCAILFLDETLVDLSITSWHLKNLNEKGSEEADHLMRKYMASTFDHLEAVLESSNGFNEYKKSWRAGRYPQNLLFNLNHELRSLEQDVNAVKAKLQNVEQSAGENASRPTP